MTSIYTPRFSDEDLAPIRLSGERWLQNGRRDGLDLRFVILSVMSFAMLNDKTIDAVRKI